MLSQHTSHGQCSLESPHSNTLTIVFLTLVSSKDPSNSYIVHNPTIPSTIGTSDVAYDELGEFDSKNICPSSSNAVLNSQSISQPEILCFTLEAIT